MDDILGKLLIFIVWVIMGELQWWPSIQFRIFTVWMLMVLFLTLLYFQQLLPYLIVSFASSVLFSHIVNLSEVRPDCDSLLPLWTFLFL